jgi:hypothetical protein
MARVPAPVRASHGFSDANRTITHPAWLQYFQGTDDHYNNVLQYTDPTNPAFGKAAPSDPIDGMQAFADNVNWIPGTKAGYYRYDKGTDTWIYLG